MLRIQMNRKRRSRSRINRIGLCACTESEKEPEIEKKSIYTKDDNEFLCIIDSYYIKDTYLKANLSCKEKLIGVYYFKDEEDIIDMEENNNPSSGPS